MKITIKSLEELKEIATSNGTSDTIDDQLLNLITFIADKDLYPDDLDIYFKQGEKHYTFIIRTLEPSKNLYNIKIPEIWVKEYDLEDYGNNYICKVCKFIVSPESKYQFEDGKIYNENTQKFERLTWKQAISGEANPVICPVCFTKNMFVKVGD